MSLVLFVILGLGGAAILLPSARGQDQAPRLTLEAATGGSFVIRATAASGTPLILEGSFTLDAWQPLSSAVATDGVARFEHKPDALAAAKATYFRVRVDQAPDEVRVVPQLDQDLTDTGVLTPEDGGNLEVMTPEGVRYEFIAGTNLLEVATSIRMTVITNFTRFPEGAGWQAAVAFEPDGLEFLGKATLRVTFPDPVPSGPLLAYSFDGDGTGFRLLEFDQTGRTLTLAVDGFSGKGVGSFPGGLPPPSRAELQSSGARRSAEDRAARRQSEIRAALEEKEITFTESLTRQRASRLQKIEEIYRDAVQPFEARAATDCSVARAVVMLGLKNLANDWAVEMAEPREASPFWRRLLEIVPGIRCHCAQEWIDRCEKEPGVSGHLLIELLRYLLLDCRTITGRSDAQGCPLGDDSQILDRLLSGPCMGPWSGTVTISRAKESVGETVDRNTTTYWDDSYHEVYTGKIRGVQGQRTFTVRGVRVQSWTLDTSGVYTVGMRNVAEAVLDDPLSDYIKHTHDKASASVSPKAEGQLNLRFENGEFATLGIGGGTDAAGPDSNVKYTVRISTHYECKPSYPTNRECPSATGYTLDTSERMFMGFSLAVDSVPPIEVLLTQRQFLLTWNRAYTNFPARRPPEVVRERIHVDLMRKP